MTTKLTIDPKHIFNLEYYGGFATYTLPAVLVRYPKMDETDIEWFGVLDATTQKQLGNGETKEDAISCAKCNLAHVAEQKSFEAGLIDRPYGKRVVKA